MDEVEYKYNPFVLIIYAVFAILMLAGPSYFLFDTIRSADYKFLTPVIILFSLSGLVAYYILSFFYNMIKRVPAIVLTRDFLVLSNPSLKISYADITDVVIRTGSRNTRLGINLDNPEKYFNTPLSKFFFKLRSSDPENFSINLDLIWGKNEEIGQSVTDYWHKYANSKAKTPHAP